MKFEYLCYMMHDDAEMPNAHPVRTMSDELVETCQHPP